MEPHDEINVLMGESFPPHEGTKRGRLSTNQEVGPHQTPDLLAS